MIVTARLLDGTVWRGEHMAHDVESEESFRTLFLAPPLSRRSVAGSKLTEYGAGDYVVIPLDQVSSLQLKYLSGSRKAAGATEG